MQAAEYRSAATLIGTKKDAEDALARIEVVDRAGTAARAADLARQAMAQSTDVPPNATRVIFLGDQQVQDWKGASPATILKGLPEMQVVDVSAKSPENSWISDFHLLDGLADVSKPTRFVATVTHQGREPRHNVQVTLSVDGAEVQSKTIDLNPDQTAEVTFEYLFNDPPEPGGVRWSTAKVSLPPDRLEIDDSRFLAVPVVAALPVVFIDQYGESEDPKRNRFGETRHFRGLLAPQTAHGQEQLHLVKVVQRRMDQLEQHDLRDARLVVIAGVARPESAEGVRLLRDWTCRQGGQLVIAAGAEFRSGRMVRASMARRGGHPAAAARAATTGPNAGRSRQESCGGRFQGILAQCQSGRCFLECLFPASADRAARHRRFAARADVLQDSRAGGRQSRRSTDMVAAEPQRIDAQRKQLADLDAEIQKLSEKELRGQLDTYDRSGIARPIAARSQ